MAETEFRNYRKYVDKGEVYIIVHPGYYAFFMNKESISPGTSHGGYPSGNIVERLTGDIPSERVNLKIMKEQEQIIRDFLEYMSLEKRLVILVLPKDHKDHVVSGPAAGLDEYARFINEISNMSESVLYLESRTWDTGHLDAGDLDFLTSFLDAIGVKTVLLGGGYLGKCVDNFYESLRTKFSYEKVYFVPEITSISPTDMVVDKVKLLKNDGKLNLKGIRKYYATAGFSSGTAGEKIPLRPLTVYDVYRNR